MVENGQENKKYRKPENVVFSILYFYNRFPRTVSMPTSQTELKPLPLNKPLMIGGINQ
jgi:hypothetical protein